MGLSFWMWLLLTLVLLHHSPLISTQTEPGDTQALTSLANNWKNKPFNWVAGGVPCENENRWVGINCSNSRVTEMRLSSLGLVGTLSDDIGNLAELQILDLSYNADLTGNLPPAIGKLSKLTILAVVGCSFSGAIPDLSSLQQLTLLSLNSNHFSGRIPPSIGSLMNLIMLDLSDNKLTGTIPVSSGNISGLDKLKIIQHFHLGKNQLSGEIPKQLFSSNMTLIHLLLDNNNLSGSIPSTIGLVKTLKVIRLDWNSLSGHVPLELSSLTSVGEMYLSNNRLTGPLPNLTGMNALSYVDLSNNSFDPADVPPWFSTLQSLTSLVMEYLQVRGEIPAALFSIPQLQTVRLRNNHLGGSLNITNYSSQLQLVDLRKNNIEDFSGTYNRDLILVDNPICNQRPDEKHCENPQQQTPYSSPLLPNCKHICPSDQSLSPNCMCSYPYTGTLYFRAPTFSDLANRLNFQTLEANLTNKFKFEHLPVDSVSLCNISWDSKNYLEVGLQVFPASKTHFNQTEGSEIGYILGSQTFQFLGNFGSFYFLGSPYNYFPETAPGPKPKHLPLILGAAVGGFFTVVIILCLAVYASQQKRKAKMAVAKSLHLCARWFSFDELKQSTNDFSEANELGVGGYGKVYKGVLANGHVVAIKRAQHESVQGEHEFKTEIELLSRVHHKNLVSLVGFCFEQGEQILVYEYIPNGSLRDSLTGKSGVHLDWRRRLKVALGAARGLAYLHELANPPIVHRDVKSANILLDNHLNAKVCDFGLSKPLGDDQMGPVSTQVKGTMGYLDPEYYMTQQLTEKSDVYSFGVLILELITARKPLERGQYIVREVKVAMNKSQDLYGLHELLDQSIGLESSLEGFTKFVDLAIKCMEEFGVDRPTMSEVVKGIEGIMQLADQNQNADSTEISSIIEGTSGSNHEHRYGHESISYAIGAPTPR